MLAPNQRGVAETWLIDAVRRRPPIAPPSRHQAMSAGLLPRRGELLEFAIHGAPRRLHRVESRAEPSERRDQPPHLHTRRASDGPIHIQFRIGNVKQPLYVHEAPPEGIALGDPPLLHHPKGTETQLLCHVAKLWLMHSIFASEHLYYAHHKSALAYACWIATRWCAAMPSALNRSTRSLARSA
jgi:hypothetical protein